MFVVINNDLMKQLSSTMPGKQNVCVAQTSDNVLKLLESMHSDIISLKTEVSSLKKKKDKNGKGEPSEIKNQRGVEQRDFWENAKFEDCRKGQVDDCRHCFVCGGIGHIARRCPSSDTVNDNWLRK